jgi:heme exporter protein A
MLAVVDLAYARVEADLFQPIHFILHPGQLLHVVGVNGVGKTTLLKLLAGLFPPSQGRIEWSGVSITGIRDHYALQRHFIAHELALKANLTVRQNLHYNFFCSKDETNVGLAIKALGLESYLDYPVHALSVGFAHKLSLIRLLTSMRPLWILDEVFSALDQTAVTWLQMLIQSHCQQGGMAIITSHQSLPLRVDGQIHMQVSTSR